MVIKGKEYPYVAAIGFELEGAWDYDTTTRIPFVRDGSAQVRNRPEWRCDPRNFDGYGADLEDVPYSDVCDEIEWNSPALYSLDEVPDLLKRFYPRWISEACGLHVHMSFKSRGSYVKMVDERLTDRLFNGIEQFAEQHRDPYFPEGHPIWERIAGENDFCRREFRAQGQARRARKGYRHNGEDDRYTAVAYHWKRLKTVECRLLPMMPTLDLAAKAIEHVCYVMAETLIAFREEPEPIYTASPSIAPSVIATRNINRRYVLGG